MAVQKQMLVVGDYHSTTCITNSEGTEGWFVDTEDLVDLFCKEPPPFNKWAAILIGINTTAAIILVAFLAKAIIQLRYLCNRGYLDTVAFFFRPPQQ